MLRDWRLRTFRTQLRNSKRKTGFRVQVYNCHYCYCRYSPYYCYNDYLFSVLSKKTKSEKYDKGHRSRVSIVMFYILNMCEADSNWFEISQLAFENITYNFYWKLIIPSLHTCKKSVIFKKKYCLQWIPFYCSIRSDLSYIMYFI